MDPFLESPDWFPNLSKQREVVASDVHLIEIDLLRGGVHISAVPRELAETKAGPFDYHAVVPPLSSGQAKWAAARIRALR
jgi:hypothetical protein